MMKKGNWLPVLGMVGTVANERTQASEGDSS